MWRNHRTARGRPLFSAGRSRGRRAVFWFHNAKERGALKLFVIEREIPGAGSMDREQYREAARRSDEVLNRLGPDIEWVESFVGDDKVYCLYRAADEGLIHRHAEMSGFPASRVTGIRTMMNPATGSRP